MASIPDQACPAVLAELPALRGVLSRTAAQTAHLSSLIAWASAADLDAAKKQAQQLKRSVGALTKRVNGLISAIGEEQQRRSHESTPNLSTSPNGDERGFYNGRVILGLAQTKENFVPTIYEILEDFPACNELGYCKVRVGDDIRRGIDCTRMNGYTLSDLEGYQSAVVGLEEWSGPARLAGKVCSIFIAPDSSDDEEIRRHNFVFPDMLAAEEAAAPDLHGYQLFCATVEGACAVDHKPYLVVPTECTSEWRRSAGLPQYPCVDCGRRLKQTAGSVAGIHTPYEYVSSAAQSGTGLHLEDAMLGSANILLAGAPKVWLIVRPNNLDALEAKMEMLGDSLRPIQPCSQFVRHLNALLSPRLLDEWDIDYDIVTCRAGEMIVTLPGAYHQVLNAGPNYAQAINFAMPDWSGPPGDYRFCCEEEYLSPHAPKAEHFRVLDSEVADEELIEEPRDCGAEFEEESDEEVEEQAEREEQDYEPDDCFEENAEGEDEPDGESEEETEEDGGNDPEGESEEEEAKQVENDEADAAAQFNALEALSKHVTSVLTNPRKRFAPPLDEMPESDNSDSDSSDCSNDDNDHNSVKSVKCMKCSQCAEDNGNDAYNSRVDHRSFQVQVRGPADGKTISLLRPTAMPPSQIERWSDCVLRTASHRGFNAEAILAAFYGAPKDQPIVKVLRTLQFLCEVANIPLLLQLRQHLLANPKDAATPTRAPNIPHENSQDVGMLVRIHQSITTLRAISWITQYELATHQLEYYRQFEAVVKMRKAVTKKATDERRNHKKRLVRRGATAGTDVVSETRRPVQTQAVVKEEIVSIMMKQGRSELAARDELEQYLKRGKTLHLLLESASPDLLPLLPLYEAEEKHPSLDFLAHNAPDDVLDSDKKELAKPITSSYVFKLSNTLAKYFGRQLFVARPEITDFQQENRCHFPAASIINLRESTEQEVASAKPAEVARLFRFNRV